MKIKKYTKSMKKNVCHAASKTSHAISKVAGKKVSIGSIIAINGLVSLCAGLGFTGGYAMGVMDGSGE